MYRLFISIDLPEKIKKQLSEICYGLPDTRWVKAEQLHLTLRFIGEVDGRIFNQLKESLAEIDMKSFSMRLKGLGHFPPRKNPRVLWVGVEADDSLVRLRNKVERVAVKCGLEPEKRKFSPHITIARFDEPHLNRVTNFLAGNSLFATDSFTVEAFHLYSSVLSQKGAIHTREVSYPLAPSC